ncbi:MAG: hypothetical protein ACYTFU_10580, partial [Planctomycetota bacterium]|jgi:hypothetical protein
LTLFEAIYADLHFYTNFFQPSLKLLVKKRYVRIPVKTITHSGRCRSLRPDDVDHPFRLIAITRERTTLAAKSYR